MTTEEHLSFTCAGATRMRRACESESFYRMHEGKSYCVLHFPAPAKNPAFSAAIKKKLEAKDFNFEGIWFPNGHWFSSLDIDSPVDFSFSFFNDRASFYETVFRAEATFEGATFNDDSTFEHTTFTKKVTFNKTRFQKNANFRKSRFEGYADFWRCTFAGRAEFDDSVFLQTVSFWPAIFESAASFSRASFVSANFRAAEFKAKAVFSWCAFGHAEFIDASFSDDADFFSARFNGTSHFAHAKFDSSVRFTMSEFTGEARFPSTAFNGATDFSHTVFKNWVEFSAEYGKGGFGENALCDFRHARFEAPGQVSFHTVTLRPHWFVNLDAREFQFVDVKWIGNLGRTFIDVEISELKRREEIEEKEAASKRAEHRASAEQYEDAFTIERMERDEEEDKAEAQDPGRKHTRFYRLLSITCRQLAVNAEEGHRYDEASDFRFWSMELKRLEGLRARGRLTIGILHALYRQLSGYGEEVGRAFVILLGVWLLFALLYTQVGFARQVPLSLGAGTDRADESGEPLRLGKALASSLEVMTLQRPDPPPLTSTARFAVIVERIFGPIQAALFALAVRRRFMR